MTNNLTLYSQGYPSKSIHTGQNCAAKDQSKIASTCNSYKWHIIRLFIMIFSMQGICNQSLLKTTYLVIASDMTSLKPEGNYGFTATWRVWNGVTDDGLSKIAEVKLVPFYRISEDNVFNLTGSGNRAAPPLAIGFITNNPGAQNSLGCRFPAICVNEKNLNTI